MQKLHFCVSWRAPAARLPARSEPSGSCLRGARARAAAGGSATPVTAAAARRRRSLVAAAAATAPAPSPAAGGATGSSSIEAGELAALQQLVRARGHEADAAEVVASEAATTYRFMADTGALPPHWRAADVCRQALLMTDVLATGSSFRSLAMLKRHPGLAVLSGRQLARQVLDLKMLMPACDVAALLYQKPSLLLHPDLPSALRPALAQLHALMPGIPIEAKLHEGGTVFWSLVSLLEAPRSGAGPAARHSTGSTPAAAAAELGAQ